MPAFSRLLNLNDVTFYAFPTEILSDLKGMFFYVKNEIDQKVLLDVRVWFWWLFDISLTIRIKRMQVRGLPLCNMGPIFKKLLGAYLGDLRKL